MTDCWRVPLHASRHKLGGALGDYLGALLGEGSGGAMGRGKLSRQRALIPMQRLSGGNATNSTANSQTECWHAVPFADLLSYEK